MACILQANRVAFRLLADIFGRKEPTFLNVVAEVCQYLFDNQHLFIKWPTGEEKNCRSYIPS